MLTSKILERFYRTRAIFIPYGKKMLNFLIFQLFPFASQESHYKGLGMYEYGMK